MILFQVKAKHPPVISEGLNLSPCPTPLEVTHSRRSRHCIKYSTPRYTDADFAAHQKGRDEHEYSTK